MRTVKRPKRTLTPSSMESNLPTISSWCYRLLTSIWLIACTAIWLHIRLRRMTILKVTKQNRESWSKKPKKIELPNRKKRRITKWCVIRSKQLLLTTDNVRTVTTRSRKVLPTNLMLLRERLIELSSSSRLQNKPRMRTETQMSWLWEITSWHNACGVLSWKSRWNVRCTELLKLRMLSRELELLLDILMFRKSSPYSWLVKLHMPNCWCPSVKMRLKSISFAKIMKTGEKSFLNSKCSTTRTKKKA